MGPISHTLLPSLSRLSVKETNFRHEFRVEAARKFGDDDISIFEMIYQRYTAEFSPDSKASSRIKTTCIVTRQSIDPTPNLVDETNDFLLVVDYTMRFESSYYDVTTYPQLFQNWVDSNLDTLLVQMRTLGFDITAVDRPKRIIVSTPAPSMVPSTIPTNSSTPSISLAPSDGTLSSIAIESKPKPEIILRSISIYIGISLIMLAVVLVRIILREGRQQEENTTPSYLKETPTISDPEDARGSQTDDVETIDLEDNVSARSWVNDAKGVHSGRPFG